MPLTAVHPEHGLIDTTLDDLGGAMTWTDIHKVRPRPALTCPACRGGLHAKLSKLPLRYFAHDPRIRVDDCPIRHESVEHHTLKNEIARAVRMAGWKAQVEASGNGWRADVLATSPDGTRTVVWEVQLSPATVEEITRRTIAYDADGHEVCWVTTKVRPWLLTVPSILIAPGREHGWVIRDGTRQLAGRPVSRLQSVDSTTLTRHDLLGPRSRYWLERTGRLPSWWDWGRLLHEPHPRGRRPGPTGTGTAPRAPHARASVNWWPAKTIGLFTFVRALQRDQLVAVELTRPHRDMPSRGQNRPIVWTTWQYLERAQALTAFALGWAVRSCETACPAGGIHCPPCTCGETRWCVLDAGPVRRHVCPSCEPELSGLARSIDRWETANPRTSHQPGPRRLTFKQGHPLVYEQPK